MSGGPVRALNGELTMMAAAESSTLSYVISLGRKVLASLEVELREALLHLHHLCAQELEAFKSGVSVCDAQLSKKSGWSV